MRSLYRESCLLPVVRLLCYFAVLYEFVGALPLAVIVQYCYVPVWSTTLAYRDSCALTPRHFIYFGLSLTYHSPIRRGLPVLAVL